MKERNRQFHANNPYMDVAIEEAWNGIRLKDGGPFGSVVVKDGKIVGRGHNRVLVNHDSTAHGEISAIRDAEQNLGTHELSGCVLYTTAEPCPMCLFACLWAGIERVYYGCNIDDTDNIGFRDEKFYDMIGQRVSLNDYVEEMDREACLELFEYYSSLEHELY